MNDVARTTLDWGLQPLLAWHEPCEPSPAEWEAHQTGGDYNNAADADDDVTQEMSFCVAAFVAFDNDDGGGGSANEGVRGRATPPPRIDDAAVFADFWVRAAGVPPREKRARDSYDVGYGGVASDSHSDDSSHSDCTDDHHDDEKRSTTTTPRSRPNKRFRWKFPIASMCTAAATTSIRTAATPQDRDPDHRNIVDLTDDSDGSYSFPRFMI